MMRSATGQVESEIRPELEAPYLREGPVTEEPGVLPACIPRELRAEAVAECEARGFVSGWDTSGLLGIGQLPEPFASAPCAAANLPICADEEAAPPKGASMLMPGIVFLAMIGVGYVGYRSLTK